MKPRDHDRRTDGSNRIGHAHAVDGRAVRGLEIADAHAALRRFDDGMPPATAF
jgi:hypothetical protein